MADIVSRRVAGLAVYQRDPLASERAGGSRMDDRSAHSDRRPAWLILVHGSMDRAASFTKATRRLTGIEVVRYDRRGYGRSVGAGLADGLEAHVEDLLSVMAFIPADATVAVVGHSFGGVVALAAAHRRPDVVRAVGAFEAPMPWTPWWPSSSAGGDALAARLRGDAGDAAERFMRRMIGDDRWERLPAATRAARRSEGPALVAELASMRGIESPPFDVSAIRQPMIIGHGSISRPHHCDAARRIANESGSELFVIEGAGHGAHHSHPEEFAAFAMRVVRSAESVSLPIPARDPGCGPDELEL